MSEKNSTLTRPASTAWESSAPKRHAKPDTNSHVVYTIFSCLAHYFDTLGFASCFVLPCVCKTLRDIYTSKHFWERDVGLKAVAWYRNTPAFLPTPHKAMHALLNGPCNRCRTEKKYSPAILDAVAIIRPRLVFNINAIREVADRRPALADLLSDSHLSLFFGKKYVTSAALSTTMTISAYTDATEGAIWLALSSPTSNSDKSISLRLFQWDLRPSLKFLHMRRREADNIRMDILAHYPRYCSICCCKITTSLRYEIDRRVIYICKWICLLRHLYGSYDAANDAVTTGMYTEIQQKIKFN